MSDTQIISSSFVVDDSILTHPLYVKWSTQTLATVMGSRSDLINDIGVIHPNQDTVHITAYLTGILYIVGGASSGLLTTF